MPKVLAVAAVFLLAAFAETVLADKLYKWVDKNGVTHFSQTPPPESESNAKAERLDYSDRRTLKPHREGKYLYCGDERLRDYGGNSAVKISNLEQNIIDQKKNISSLQERRADAVKRAWQRTKGGFDEQVRRYDTQLEVEQCKLGWAESQLAELGGERKKISDRASTVNAAIEEVEERKVSACGVDNRTGFVKADDSYRNYRKCIAPYDRELAKLRREQRSAERDQKIVEGR